ncbi:nucleotide pyrophosphohydrolase [Oceanihabitans sp. 2_MG-2023]|uniref:nucleotide pyrophosphohydrolase n=1 Tax=Oceanihabitans sp. 2_MG-2023 TaxID=3062661 RepID=UPI0026E1A5EB|nr:nucleotide pyrophosphohydrolase [Oceanihabitans sp. 2_MG-2023]MDO6598450.1 nucleotide pyrophosphohydrolase [Oceanihabitans sp. 2_MG-2023]
MIKTNFPKTDEEAKKYGGFLQHKGVFCKTFIAVNLEESVNNINNFLIKNRYKPVPVEFLDSDMSYEDDVISISPHGYKEEFVLFIKDSKSLNQTMESLIDFRDKRDWEQFHNSKDLALAISIEASELLEIFLWKDNEDVDYDKLEEELADVLSYSLLLVNKHNLDINEIISKKIAKNNEKYPVSKAKGKATKYNKL